MWILWVLGFVGLILGGWSHEVEGWDAREVFNAKGNTPVGGNLLMVNLTLIPSAAAKGAVCLDETLPAYHLDRGFGLGENSWLIHLEGGGWCNNRRTCVYREKTHHGSSNHMEKSLPFTGILSNKPEENPAFFNWNRVKVRYCDGASFSGEGYNQVGNLFFRGQRIWSAAMEELLSLGMQSANQALLSGCSAGGLSSILHCDEFHNLFPRSTKVKCFADAGLFINIADIAQKSTVKEFFNGVVTLQGVEKNLPESCTSQIDPSLCFFPQYLLDNIQTPLFILNSAYDLWQIDNSIAPKSSDPLGQWMDCKKHIANCSEAQLEVLQNFREKLIGVVRNFKDFKENGLFLNSCIAHCQSELQNMWFANDSPRLKNKRIAEAVGDWFFDHAEFKEIDCPYPCDSTCKTVR